MSDSWDSFLEAWRNLDLKEPPPVVRRLYYDDQGRPIQYSTEDLPGNCIEVDPLTYVNGDMNVRVHNGQIIKLQPKNLTTKLVPWETGTPCSPDDVCIVVDKSQPHQQWGIKHFEQN